MKLRKAFYIIFEQLLTMGNMSSLSSSFIISTSRIDDCHLNQEGKLIKIIITINGYQVIKINKIRDIIFGLR